MAAFYVFDELPGSDSWAGCRLGARVIDILKKLEDFLDEGVMPLYHLRDVNLLANIPRATLDNLRDRVRALRTNETKLISLMQNYGSSHGAATGAN